mmetsp:Transcript_45557/g.74400  ORF Transcript_45557/g.74400 Transcript_45557/m.74400 type:complete len:219 (-) Transcript_45557:652-1308(-)
MIQPKHDAIHARGQATLQGLLGRRMVHGHLERQLEESEHRVADRSLVTLDLLGDRCNEIVCNHVRDLGIMLHVHSRQRDDAALHQMYGRTLHPFHQQLDVIVAVAVQRHNLVRPYSDQQKAHVMQPSPRISDAEGYFADKCGDDAGHFRRTSVVADADHLHQRLQAIQAGPYRGTELALDQDREGVLQMRQHCIAARLMHAAEHAVCLLLQRAVLVIL